MRVALDILEFIVNNLRTNNIERNPKKGDCRTDSNSHKSMCESVNVFRNGEDKIDPDNPEVILTVRGVGYRAGAVQE